MVVLLETFAETLNISALDNFTVSKKNLKLLNVLLQKKERGRESYARHEKFKMKCR
jgi:hypothetical protein